MVMLGFGCVVLVHSLILDLESTTDAIEIDMIYKVCIDLPVQALFSSFWSRGVITILDDVVMLPFSFFFLSFFFFFLIYFSVLSISHSLSHSLTFQSVCVSVCVCVCVRPRAQYLNCGTSSVCVYDESV